MATALDALKARAAILALYYDYIDRIGPIRPGFKHIAIADFVKAYNNSVVGDKPKRELKSKTLTSWLTSLSEATNFKDHELVVKYKLLWEGKNLPRANAAARGAAPLIDDDVPNFQWYFLSSDGNIGSLSVGSGVTTSGRGGSASITVGSGDSGAGGNIIVTAFGSSDTSFSPGED